MRTVEKGFTALVESIAPDGTMTKMRARASVDTLVTLAVTALAIVLSVGYQVVGRWARRAGWVD